jgi:uncharacterized protein
MTEGLATVRGAAHALLSIRLIYLLHPARSTGNSPLAVVLFCAVADELVVPGVPFPLVPSSAGLWRVDETVGAVTEGDFQFSARVTAGFASTFDAGVLLLWLDERRWAKLCFEFSPAGEPMVVSVVCRGVSDDANAFAVRGRSVWLRVSRVDRVYAYHASLDGRAWQMIRVFVLDDETSRDKIGFEGQSPTGDGCSVTFDQIRFLPERLADLRDGS